MTGRLSTFQYQVQATYTQPLVQRRGQSCRRVQFCHTRRLSPSAPQQSENHLLTRHSLAWACRCCTYTAQGNVSSSIPMALTGKSVVVTGGSRGIGKGLVEKLLSRQNNVIATTRSPQDASQLQQLAAQHANLTVTQLDTSQPQSIKDWAATVKQHTSHVDILINNAGMYGRRLQLAEFEADDFMTVFQTNTVGPFLVVQQLLQQGLLGPPGSLVVNVSSIMASHGDETVSGVTPGGYAYRASKAALNIINKALLLDLKEQQVQCCCVHPGYVKTDMTGGAGWVDVEESSSGIMKVLEDGRPLNGKWYSYSGDEIPW